MNPLPFVYKTVVVTAVYSSLVISVVAEQDIGKTHIQLYFPLFGVLKVIFFVGWLKVALAMENPLRSDFHLESILDRHIKVYQVLVGEGEEVVSAGNDDDELNARQPMGRNI